MKNRGIIRRWAFATALALTLLLSTVGAGTVFAGGAGEASAETARQAPIVIHDAWARETPGDTRVSAAYFVIENRGDADDALIGASTPVAGTVELHTVERQGDVMRMRQVFAIQAPAGEQAVLQQGGLHVMLMELQGPLEAGDIIPLTLTFDASGDITIDVEVRPLRGAVMHARD